MHDGQIDSNPRCGLLRTTGAQFAGAMYEMQSVKKVVHENGEILTACHSSASLD